MGASSRTSSRSNPASRGEWHLVAYLSGHWTAFSPVYDQEEMRGNRPESPKLESECEVRSWLANLPEGQYARGYYYVRPRTRVGHVPPGAAEGACAEGARSTANGPIVNVHGNLPAGCSR